MSEPSTSGPGTSGPGTSEPGWDGPGRDGPTPFPTVGLLGLGSTGAGIAQVFAASGRHVVVLETDRARLDAGLAAVAASFDAELTQGRATDRSATPGRITGTLAVADLAGADLVLESATEDAEPKKALLARVAAVVGERTPIVTSTSDLSV
ncbi:MAG: hypothetical protein HOV83_12690, partial [Catenulispora sp.]|nr:hypothetical protein [Catenulispora sp.]